MKYKLSTVSEILKAPSREGLTFREIANVTAGENSQILGSVYSISESSNPLKKVLSILIVFIRINLLRKRLQSKGKREVCIYGVYPKLEEPVAIFELDSEASAYIYKNVLGVVLLVQSRN